MPETLSVGAERIEAAFARAKAEGRAALMPYMMGGFPDPEASIRVATAYADAGADLIELGVPYSDPLADGPVIHNAATVALSAGVRFENVLDTCRAVSDRVPVVLMAYTNMVLGKDGPGAFAERAIAAGASGVIVPDLPLGEDEPTRNVLNQAGLAVVPLIAPTTLGARREEICRIAAGFVYVVSSVGTTGERREVPVHLRELVEDVKGKAEVPVAVGFGIGTPDQAGEVGGIADGVIIGSKLVRLVADAPDTDTAVAEVTRFLAETRAAIER
ncbi:MAG TPA: tryptophan synthase subunit alpha [Solirubrobacterales bacterium]|nr:tryptophan synthase subunit alpha [Solirubrobacterales bacterium]